MVSTEKATAVVLVELVSINPVHRSNTATANPSSEKTTENTASGVTLMDSETNTQRHDNFISVAGDPMKFPLLNGTVHTKTGEETMRDLKLSLNTFWHQLSRL